MEPIQIQMLGDFSLQVGENKVSDNDNRSKKVWILLAYMLCHRGRVISAKELIELLWGDDPASSNPENALKITFHRVRTMLNRLYPSAGHQLILHRDVGYAWNSEVPITVDIDIFDRLSQPRSEDGEAQLQSYLSALELYQGDFLEKLSSENWIIPITTHFHNLYVQAVLESVPLLAERGRHQEAITICRTAVGREPYHELLHQLLIRELAATDDQKGAAAVYETLSKRLFDDFGIMPSEETRSVYREATHTLSEQALPMEAVLEHLQEKDAAAGAMRCEYDYFKVLCYAETRAMQRSGKATHIALLSVASGTRSPLSKRSMDKAMEHLGEQIRLNLRRGDVFSRCSVSQYIIMLPEANYENSCMVCRRLMGAFFRKHPHSPAKINFMVQPLSANISVP